MTTPKTQVTDFSTGLQNICRATSTGIYDVVDDYNELVPNTLCIDMFPRYVLPTDEDDDEEFPSRINSSTVLGDIFSAITHLEAEVRSIKKMVPDMTKITQDYDKVEHMIEHIRVLENNLRSLHETLTYDGTPIAPLQLST